jgi:hypothetical protein
LELESKEKGQQRRRRQQITSNKGLESITLAAITAAISTFTEPGIATINLKVNAQPVINLRKLLELKHNHNQLDDFNNPKGRE